MTGTKNMNLKEAQEIFKLFEEDKSNFQRNDDTEKKLSTRGEEWEWWESKTSKLIISKLSLSKENFSCFYIMPNNFKESTFVYTPKEHSWIEVP